MLLWLVAQMKHASLRLAGTRSTASLTPSEKMGTRWNASLPGSGAHEVEAVGAPPHPLEATACGQPLRPQTFLRLAWLAIPFSYIAINTLLAVIPGLALRLQLSTAESGAFCSIWLFVRLGTFLLLWQWSGWHYRFGWLVAACAGLAASFATLLLVGQLWVLHLGSDPFWPFRGFDLLLVLVLFDGRGRDQRRARRLS